MGNTEIFLSGYNVLVTLASMLILFVAVSYVSRTKEINKGAWFLLAALALDLLVTYLSYKFTYYQRQGVSLNILVFVELTLLLVGMIFLALAASQILDNELSNLPIISGIAGLGLISVIYFVILSPDGTMVASMRNIFPIAGFFYISASLWSKAMQGSKPGYIIAAVTTTVLALISLIKLVDFDHLSLDAWYITPIAYVSLAISLFITKGDLLNQNIKEYKVKVDAYNQRIEDIIKSSPFPIIISRLSDDRLILANNNAIKLFGIHPKEIERYKLKDFFVDKENRQSLNERLEQEKEVQDFEVLVKTTTGNTPFWLLTSANVIDYNYDIAIYAAFQDITGRKTRENLLKNQAIRDPLTSLFNRRYFEEEVGKRIANARLENMNYSVLMVDADHFKKVNDTYGHKTGDSVLIELAQTCEKALRTDDIVARYGGEEFVIFLSKVNGEKAFTVAERLRQTISELAVKAEDDSNVKFTVSIGISSSDVSDNIEMLIKMADEALYKAKSNGRNRSEIFTSKDLKAFQKDKGGKEKKNKLSSRHPIFDKEDSEEISLLDGIAANQITTVQSNIEDEK